VNIAIRGGAPLDASLRGRNNAVGKAHAPGKIGGSAVVTIAGKKAADTTDGVTERGGGSAGVEELPEGELDAMAKINHGAEAAEESTEPGEAVAGEDECDGMGEEFGGRFKEMVELGASDACKAGDSDHAEGVGLQAAADEIGVKNVGGEDEGERDHQTEAGNLERAQV